MCATLKTIHLALSPKLKPHATKISGTGNRSKHSFVHPSLGSLYPYRKYTPARPAQDHQILTHYGADAEGNSTTKAPVDISDLSLSVHPTSSFTFLYSHLPLPLVIVSCSTAHTHTHPKHVARLHMSSGKAGRKNGTPATTGWRAAKPRATGASPETI